jgi:NADP-dependent 3-hydroxy acid dehydrogenase YdfG
VRRSPRISFRASAGLFLVHRRARTSPDAELARQAEGTLDEVGALSAEELADLVAYVTSRPRRVSLRKSVALPTRQV